jgi:hypothetical protein
MYLLDNDVSIEDVSDIVNSGYDNIKHYYDKRSKTSKRRLTGRCTICST